MKKIFLIFSFALVVIAANAQGGIKAGANFSSWRGDDIDSDEIDMLIGFYFGAYYNVKVSDRFSIQPELVYSGEGVKSADDDFKYKFSYLNLTPLARFNTASGFFVGTGPQLGFLLSAKAKDEDNSVDVKDSFKGINFSWALALGYEMKSGFGIYGRYNLGLSNIVDSDDSDIKTGVIQVGLRYNLFGSKDGQKSAKK